MKIGVLKILIILNDKMEVIKKINNSQSAAPTFIIPKINNTVRFISK